MVARALPTELDEAASGWERALYAFLTEKKRRSGSRRTVEGYSRMLRHFFGSAGKPPDRISSQEVFAWAYGTGASGKPPSSVPIGARLASVSSFYRFLVRMGAIATNPCDALERPRTLASPPRGLAPDEVRQLLAAIPETPTGFRDRAIVLTLVLAGRRRAEILNLQAGDISIEDGRPWYRYRGSMSTWKLQKLVYYSQAWSLVWDERPLFHDRVEAWANGPVVPTLYAVHRGMFDVQRVLGGRSSRLNDTAKETIDAVLSKYGSKSSQWLRDLTHREPPWQLARERAGLADGERGSSEIRLGDMADSEVSNGARSRETSQTGGHR